MATMGWAHMNHGHRAHNGWATHWDITCSMSWWDITSSMSWYPVYSNRGSPSSSLDRPWCRLNCQRQCGYYISIWLPMSTHHDQRGSWDSFLVSVGAACCRISQGKRQCRICAPPHHRWGSNINRRHPRGHLCFQCHVPVEAASSCSLSSFRCCTLLLPSSHL